MCIYVRALTAEEGSEIDSLTRSSDTVTHRHARTILLSAQGIRAPKIAETLGYTSRAVGKIINAFNKKGVSSLPRGKAPGRPRICDDRTRDAIVELLHRPPSDFGIQSALWTAPDLAVVAMDQGIVETISEDTIRKELRRARMRWQRAKRWSTSPDPDYEKKGGAYSV